MSDHNYLVPGQRAKQLELELNSLSDVEYSEYLSWRKNVTPPSFVLDEFIAEVSLVEKDWVREARKRYLKHEMIKLAIKITDLQILIFDCHEQVYQWFGELVEEQYLKPLERQFQKIKQQLYMWDRRLDEITLPRESYTDEEIEAVKAIEISNFVEIVKEVGGRGWAHCPFHEGDKTPSFCWYRKTNSFYSFCCGKGGDVIRLVMDIEHLDFTGAVDYLLKYL